MNEYFWAPFIFLCFPKRICELKENTKPFFSSLNRDFLKTFEQHGFELRPSTYTRIFF